jgi:hypothetical protein
MQELLKATPSHSLTKIRTSYQKRPTDFLLPSSAAIFVELGKILSGKNDAGEIKDGRLAH